MPRMPNLPNLAQAERDEVLDTLKQRYGGTLPEATLRQLAAGDFKAASGAVERQAKEAEESDDLKRCLQLAQTALDGALKAAEALTNPVAKAIAIAGAYAVFILAQISCYDDHG